MGSLLESISIKIKRTKRLKIHLYYFLKDFLIFIQGLIMSVSFQTIQEI